MENGELLMQEYAEIRKVVNAFRKRWPCVISIDGWLHLQEDAFVGLANQTKAKITISQTAESLHLDATINDLSVVACINNKIISPREEVKNAEG